MSINKVILVGNVGKDPEVRHLDSGVSTASFTLATQERFKDKNGNNQEITEWHNIVCWRNLAKLAEDYIRKGAQLYIEGRIRSRQWEDANSVKHTRVEILADTIQLLGRKGDKAAELPVATPTTTPATPTPAQKIDAPTNTQMTEGDINTEDDLPF